MSSITSTKGGALVITTPYHRALIDALKTSIPSSDRKWDSIKRHWVVDSAHAATVQRLIQMHLGETVDLPDLAVAERTPTSRLLSVRYLGRTKIRDDGTETAFAWVNGGWNAIFPAAVLRQWFGQPQRPDESSTLYNVLGVSNTAAVAEIRAAWKRLARQWHPDVCHEPDAARQFQTIRTAFDILSDDNKRARYDAGLALEASLRTRAAVYVNEESATALAAPGWAPPLRCGLITVRGTEKLKRFIVTEILEWKDIVRGDGHVLVSSWPAGAEHFSEEWVRP